MRILLTISFFFLAQLNYGQVNLTSGLAAYYPFNGNADDASGNLNNAIFNNATLTTGVYGDVNSAYLFNGSSSYIQIPSSASLNVGAQITLSAFVKVEGFYQGLCHGNEILNKGQHSGNFNAYILRFDDGAYTLGANCSIPTPDEAHQIFFGINTSAPGGYTPYIVLDQWYSVIYTNDGTTTQMYVDGVLKASNPTTAINFSNSDDLFLGRLYDPVSPSSFPYWFNGVMDEVRIYNRVINAGEIAALSQLSVLPVTITNFSAEIQHPDKIRLTWATENEENIKEYAIEKSYGDDQHFSQVGTVSVKGGHANNYSYSDENVQRGTKVSYRLAIKEISGSTRFSDIRVLKIPSGISSMNVYANPGNGSVKFKVNGYSGKANIVIYNPLGQVVLKQFSIVKDGIPIDVILKTKSKGLYQLRVETDLGSFNKQIIL